MWTKMRNASRARKSPSPRKTATKALSTPSSKVDSPTPGDFDRWLQRQPRLPRVRKALVKRIKAQIAQGAYETPRKLEIALERMLRNVGGR
jgi:anti-sigma28 factor (negative regulator of flagellin synthesis)